MKYQLKVDSAVSAKFPGYKAVVLYVLGLDNSAEVSEAADILQEAHEYARAHYDADTLGSHPNIAIWRQTYTEFGSKSKYRSAADAMLKRVLEGKEIQSISTVVDLYNSVSIRHAISVGGEDWDQLHSDLVLGFATGQESFPMRVNGQVVNDPPAPGEVIWADVEGATCRRWNWQQCLRTRITPETTNAYFVFDSLPPMTEAQLMASVEEFSELLTQFNPDCHIERQILA